MNDIPPVLVMISEMHQSDRRLFFFEWESGLFISIDPQSKPHPRGWLSLLLARDLPLSEYYKVAENALRTMHDKYLPHGDHDQTLSQCRDIIQETQWKLEPFPSPRRYYSLAFSQYGSISRHLFLQSANPPLIGTLVAEQGKPVSSTIIRSPFFSSYKDSEKIILTKRIYQDFSNLYQAHSTILVPNLEPVGSHKRFHLD